LREIQPEKQHAQRPSLIAGETIEFSQIADAGSPAFRVSGEKVTEAQQNTDQQPGGDISRANKGHPESQQYAEKRENDLKREDRAECQAFNV